MHVNKMGPYTEEVFYISCSLALLPIAERRPVLGQPCYQSHTFLLSPYFPSDLHVNMTRLNKGGADRMNKKTKPKVDV
jgi:hypothetical protein